GLDHAVELANRARNAVFSDMAKTGLEDEIERLVAERHVEDRAEPVEFLQAFRRPRMDRAIVLDAPGIDPALAQRADQLAARRACDQKLVAFRPVPDDLDQLHQIVGIAELLPDIAVWAEAAIVVEIVAVDLV